MGAWLPANTEKARREYFELTSKNQSYWVETVESITDIKINNYEKQKRWKWENIQARLYQVNMRVMTVNNAQTWEGNLSTALRIC